MYGQDKIHLFGCLNLELMQLFLFWLIFKTFGTSALNATKNLFYQTKLTEHNQNKY